MRIIWMAVLWWTMGGLGVLKGQADSAGIAREDTTAFTHLAMKGIGKNHLEFLRTMIPTLEDCRTVFKGNGANLVHSFTKSMFGDMTRSASDFSVAYVDFRTSHFSVEDAMRSPEALRSGMMRIREYLLPGTTFYQVTYLEEAGSEFGVTYRYFVQVGDHWVYFPKPWRAFETQD
jgi:hypothetical protein